MTNYPKRMRRLANKPLTEKEWDRLMEGAGFRIVRVHNPHPPEHDLLQQWVPGCRVVCPKGLER